MKLAIIGAPQAGKTTLFNALSGQDAAVGDYSRTEHRAVIKVPDRRVEDLAVLEESKKITHAEMEFLDTAGFSGKGKEASGEISSTHDLKQVDAFVIVLDHFSDDANPERDFNSIIDEMILADLMLVEDNVEKLSKKMKLTGKKDRARELEILEICRGALNEEKLLSEIGLSEEDEKIIRGYTFLSLKPQIAVFNISEDLIGKTEEFREKYSKYRLENIREISIICGKLEMELAQLPEEEEKEFLKELGLKAPAVERFIQISYNLLGLISFLTAGPPESRAWTIKRGTSAPKAAGTIHTDFERGFIKAEVTTYDDYMQYKSMAALKAAAKVRLEGKDYIVKDGDVILFRFNL